MLRFAGLHMMKGLISFARRRVEPGPEQWAAISAAESHWGADWGAGADCCGVGVPRTAFGE